MKNLIITLLLVMPVAAISQEKDNLEFVKMHVTEEYPGAAGSPVIFRAVYYFVANEDCIVVEAVINDGSKDSVIDSRTLDKGDRLALQFVTYNYNDGNLPVEETVFEEPYFVEVEKDIVSLVFPDYNLDRIKTTTSFPVYYVNGEKYSFELPVIKEEDIERIYYP